MNAKKCLDLNKKTIILQNENDHHSVGKTKFGLLYGAKDPLSNFTKLKKITFQSNFKKEINQQDQLTLTKVL